MARLRRYEIRLRQVSRKPAKEKLAWAGRYVARRWTEIRKSRESQAGAGIGGSTAADGSVNPEQFAAVLRTQAVSGPGANVLLMQERAASVYLSPDYDGVIDLIWADERPGVRRIDPTRGWGSVSRGVRVHPLVASHIGLITNDLPKLAGALRTVLEQADLESESEAAAGAAVAATENVARRA